MTNNTFSREDLANHTRESQTDESDESAEEIEAADEVLDEGVEAHEPALAARTSRPTEPEEDDIEIPEFGDERLPDVADPDVNFDTDKLRAKTAQYISRRAERAVAQLQTRTRINEKLSRFAKDHPDFEEVVHKNPVLASNQLGPDAAITVARSKHTAELLYRFGKDPALAIRVAKMIPRHQVWEVANMIRDIEDERKSTARTESARRQTAPARKGTPTREDQLGGKGSMAEFAAASRTKRYSGRHYK